MMKINLSIYVLIVFLLVGCSSKEQQNAIDNEQTASNEQGNVELEVIAENLDIPWSTEKRDHTFYLTERPGSIIKLENGEVERQRVELKQDISTAPEAGLLGFVLAPDFAESNLAYAIYTYVDDFGQFNRIVILRLEDNIWREESLLLDHIPSGTYHHGGRLKIGPDGMLYATTGDASEPSIAQDLDSLGGKILRMNLDGSIPSDIPFPDSYM